MASDDRLKGFVQFMVLLLIMILDENASAMDASMKGMMKEAALKQGIDPDNLQPGQILYAPPDLSDEEEGSQFMPKAHRCEGCLAVAYQLENKAFHDAEKQKKKGEKLKEYEVIDAIETLCNKGFDREYGLKNVGGKNILSGVGLKGYDEPGMMEAGGRWQARLQNMCKELVEIYEEDGIYDLYLNKGDKKLASTLCVKYCRGTDEKKIKEEL